MSQIKHAWSAPTQKICYQDVYSVLNPMMWFGRIVGIFPLTLKGRKYSSSYVSIIYSLIVLVLTIAGLFLATDHTNERWANLSQHAVVETSIHLEMLLQLSSMVFIVGAAVIHREKYANAIDILNSQDILLQKFGVTLDYATELKEKYIQLGIIIIIIVILCTYDFVYQLNFNLCYPLNWIAWMSPNIIRIISGCQFVDIVIILKQRFAILNEYLKEMINATKNSSPMTTSVYEETCGKIRSLAKIHGSLCEAALSVNQTFGYSIIAGVVYALVILTTTMYYIFQEIKSSDPSYIHIFGCLNWGAVGSIHIIYTVTACHFAQNQASLTGKLIHKFPIDGFDTPLTNLIQSFSLQFYHEEIEFSGAGLFPLDATLIQSIAGAVTTYVVILIQFDTSTSQIPIPHGPNTSST